MHVKQEEQAKHASTIKLIVLDVDGVLSDGKITYSNDGKEYKSFNVKDGLGISMGIHLGLAFAIITARISSIVDKRADDLGIQHVFQGKKNKRPVLLSLMETLHLSAEQVAYIGDDIPDLPCMKLAGLSACPANASKTVLEEAGIISSLNGGEGAVREIIEFILEAQGHVLGEILR
jgi:3-deoxy-D-manno-octulosonate 8-phosphate phosphatase (KDO 8-P phosphatase)